MILDISLPFVLNEDSVARVMCDAFFDSSSDLSIDDQFLKLLDLDESGIETKVRTHLTKFGKLGIPNNKQLAAKYRLTEAEAQAFVERMKSHLARRGS